MEVGITGQINWPFLAQIRPSLTEVSHVERLWRWHAELKGGAQRAQTLKA
jgi:hypothetical protein